jgi:hypothetical protein
MTFSLIFNKLFEKFQPRAYYHQNDAYDKNSSAFNQLSQPNFFSTGLSPLAQQQYACQKCNFFSNDLQAILAHLTRPLHLKVEIPRASAFQRPEPPFNTTFSDPHITTSIFHNLNS